MDAMANGAECDKKGPIVIHCVVADGDASEVIESLDSFAEHLNGSRMLTKERDDPRIVTAAFGNALSRIERRWLLCLNNVDKAVDPDVNALLNSVASMTGSHGWVIVTPRTGSEVLWSLIKLEQNLALQPLSEKEAKRLLWRLKKSRNTGEISENDIREQVTC